MKYKHACITIFSSVQGERCETYTTLKISHCKEIYFNAKTSRILLMLYTIFFFRSAVFVLRNASKSDLAGKRRDKRMYICEIKLFKTHTSQSGYMVKIPAWNRNQNRVCYLSIIIFIHVCTSGIIWNDCKELFLFIRVSMSLLYYDNTFFFEYFNLLVIDISVDRKNLKILMKFNPGFFFQHEHFQKDFVSFI